ncbi:hypothetical protein BCR36DRAFT_308599 [Piromyces finnis]|uniref:LysM domain-containing protein n=1 Tax=Piromyces finnis TaxID=1754191 RepID=A0A1Y1UX63_9FUNG|nr:hypothetical protein BCR36DRAFT_308599 [Piromyces finnis]|eukprot:ORX42088.1 hypothetical protein BCR36DRAFT_308599 [Piromyces finnis]
MITHEVKKTDTLEGISLRYNVSIAKIKKVNKIYSKDVLLCMDKILIPEKNDILSPKENHKIDINITTIPNNSNTYYNNGNSQHNSIINTTTTTTHNSNSINNYSTGSPSSSIIFDQGNSLSSRSSSLRKEFKQSTSEISSLNEFFENFDKTIMDTVNKSNISLPLLIKSQLEVYQNIPTYDPNNDIKSK